MLSSPAKCTPSIFSGDFLFDSCCHIFSCRWKDGPLRTTIKNWSESSKPLARDLSISSQVKNSTGCFSLQTGSGALFVAVVLGIEEFSRIFTSTVTSLLCNMIATSGKDLPSRLPSSTNSPASTSLSNPSCSFLADSSSFLICNLALFALPSSAEYSSSVESYPCSAVSIHLWAEIQDNSFVILSNFLLIPRKGEKFNRFRYKLGLLDTFKIQGGTLHLLCRGHYDMPSTF